MATNCNLRSVRNWIPRITMLFSAVVFLVFLSGVGYLLTYILESSSYFSVEIPKIELGREGLNPEKEQKIKEALTARSAEREKLKQGVMIDPDGKNPFNWP